MVSFFRYIILLTVIVLPLILSCGKDNGLVKGVNVVLVLTDDQGWGDVGYHGNDIIETPVIDSIAKQGVVFDRFYVSPVCAPTRASLLTGKYHLATGTSWVTNRKEVMRSEEVTLAEILQSEGYETACFGKWHNGAQYPHNPNGQGFKTFFGFSAGHWNNYFDTELEYNGKMVSTKGYMPDVLTDSVLTFIKRNKDKPFFAYVAYNTPHTPYQVPDSYFDKYKSKGLDNKTACIYGMCENIDDNIDRILNQLEESNIAENTIFIFMSDNGPNYDRFNGGYKGHKAQVDEGGVRVPFIIRYPNGKFKASAIKLEMAAHIDVLPTILDLCNITKADSLQIDGISLKPLLLNEVETLPKRSLYTHHVIRNFDTFPGALRTNKHLLVLTPQDTALYDLLTDPYQKVDIADRAPYKVDEYIDEYKKWFNNVTKNGVTPEPICINTLEEYTTSLPAHEATLLNGTTFHGVDGWANDWSEGSGIMKWNVRIYEEGNYEIAALYTCNKKGVQLSINCGSQQTSTSIEKVTENITLPSQDRVLRNEVYEKVWSELEIGELNLMRGETELTLDITSNEENLQVEIKSINIKKI